MSTTQACGPEQRTFHLSAMWLLLTCAYGPVALLEFPAVVPPQDVFFEGTGVLTLLFGILGARYLWRLLRR